MKPVAAGMKLEMHRVQMLPRVLTVLTAFIVVACSSGGEADAQQAPDYRYRLTVEVDTPEGVKAGRSVIEVRQRLVRLGSDPSKFGVERR